MYLAIFLFTEYSAGARFTLVACGGPRRNAHRVPPRQPRYSRDRRRIFGIPGRRRSAANRLETWARKSCRGGRGEIAPGSPQAADPIAVESLSLRYLPSAPNAWFAF